MTNLEALCEHALQTLPESLPRRAYILHAVEECLAAVRHPLTGDVRAVCESHANAMAGTDKVIALFAVESKRP